jgi:hypothetical protein
MTLGVSLDATFPARESGHFFRAIAVKRCRCAPKTVAGRHRVKFAKKSSLQNKSRVLQT